MLADMACPDSIVASPTSVKLGHPHSISALCSASPSSHPVLARIVEKSGAISRQVLRFREWHFGSFGDRCSRTLHWKVRSSGQILGGRWLDGARIDIAGRNLTKRRGFPRTRKIDT